MVDPSYIQQSESLRATSTDGVPGELPANSVVAFGPSGKND